MAILVVATSKNNELTEPEMSEGQAFSSKLKHYLLSHHGYSGEVFYVVDQSRHLSSVSLNLEQAEKGAKQIPLSSVGRMLNKIPGASGHGCVVNYLIVLALDGVNPKLDFSRFVRGSYLAKRQVQLVFNDEFDDKLIESIREHDFKKFFNVQSHRVNKASFWQDDAFIARIALAFMKDLPRDKRMYRNEFNLITPERLSHPPSKEGTFSVKR